jgi:hypothetical protein
MTVLRVSVTVRLPGGGTLVDEHLSVAWHRTGWLDAADVIVCPTSTATPELIADVLDRHPGCLVAAAGCDRGCLVGVRGGPVVALDGRDPWAAASIVHAWRTVRRRLGSGPVRCDSAGWPACPDAAWRCRLRARRVP